MTITSRFLAIISFLALILFVFPFYWMLKSSLEPSTDLFSPQIGILPVHLTFNSYEALFSQTDFLIYLQNSLIVAFGCMALNMTVSCLAGYGLARLRISGKRTFARATLFTYMFPPMLLGIPFYVLFGTLGLRNTYTGIILAQATMTIPFSIWLMWQFFQTIPISYEESAWVSGASLFRSFLTVSLPLALPGIIAVSLFSFALSWGDYTYCLFLLTENSMRTIPLGLNFFVELPGIHWGIMEAASVLVSLPGFLLVLFFQKYLVSGFGMGGLKG